MFKALIVDDEEDIREGLRDIINWEEEGFSIVGLAEDGVDALEQYQRTTPHLIVTDIRMTRMDGLELSRRIKALNTDVKVLIISGYDEFSYAKKAIQYGIENYLLKPIDTEELRKELGSIRTQMIEQDLTKQSELLKDEELKNYFLLRMVRDDISKAYTPHEMERHRIDYRSRYFTTILIDFKEGFDEEIEWSVDDFQLKVFAIKNVIGEIVEQIGDAALFEVTKGRLGILIWGGISQRQFEEELVVETTRKISYLTPKYTKHDIHLGVGDTVESLTHISHSYQHAEIALEMRFYSNQEHVFYYSKLYPKNTMWNIQWSEIGLLNAIKDLNRRRIHQEVDILFQEIRSLQFTSDILQKLFMFTMVGLAKLIYECKSDWEFLYKSKGLRLMELVHNGSIEVSKQVFYELCLEVSRILEKSHLKNSESYIEDIIDYINQHYFEDLNLKKLSDFFYLNPYYIGKLIKKKQGESFNEYMNKIRIEQAKLMLSDTLLSISDISDKVGYKYLNHFYKIFKDITGISPGEFRKDHA